MVHSKIEIDHEPLGSRESKTVQATFPAAPTGETVESVVGIVPDDHVVTDVRITLEPDEPDD